MTVEVIARNTGYTIAANGQTLHLSAAEANELRQGLGTTLTPVSTAVTPAKAQLMRYPVQPRRA